MDGQELALDEEGDVEFAAVFECGQEGADRAFEVRGREVEDEASESEGLIL